MYHFSVAHLKMPLDKIQTLWLDHYYAEHLKKPKKNTVSVQRPHLAIFNDVPWIVGLKLQPISAFFGVTPPNSIMPPHRDPSSNPAVIEKGFDYHPWAMNIPLTCDMGSLMRWHRVKSGQKTRLDGAGHSPYNNVRVPMADEEDLVEMASVCLDRPMLVNTFEWHSVSNNTDQTRLIFSLRFDPIMTLPQAARVFTSMLP
jgi:hypothetical protein